MKQYFHGKVNSSFHKLIDEWYTLPGKDGHKHVYYRRRGPNALTL
jgi:hypothetical protein